MFWRYQLYYCICFYTKLIVRLIQPCLWHNSAFLSISSARPIIMDFNINRFFKPAEVFNLKAIAALQLLLADSYKFSKQYAAALLVVRV